MRRMAKKVLIFEYVCGGGFQGEAPPPGLQRQGRAMLQAVLADFARLSAVQVYTLVEERFDVTLPPGVHAQMLDRPWPAAWRDLVRQCEAALVVAPEGDRQLERLCAEVLAQRRQSLNCPPEVIRLAADKWALNEHLRAAGVAAVETRRWDPAQMLPDAA